MDATHATPNRAGIYCRLSYAPDGSVEKVERQEADCRDLAARQNWPVSDQHVYVDNSRSAWQRTRKRPAWERMLADLETGAIDSIIVYHGDRLMRQPYDLERLISIAERGGVRIASVSGTRDLDSPDDRFILRIEVAAQCRESDATSRRIRRTLTANRALGKTQRGGYRPFGYGVQVGTKERPDPASGAIVEVPVYDLDQQVPAEARYVRDAADRLLAGQSQAGVLAWLRAEGVTTTQGGPMTARGLRTILLAPRTAGLIEHQGELYEAAWEGILTRETWEDVRAYYQHSAAENPYPGRERKYLLTGVAVCHACQTPVRTKPSGGRNRKTARIYCCTVPGCRAVGRSVAHLDAYVQARTLRVLQDPAFVGQVLAAAEGRPEIAAEMAELERRRSETQAQLDQLADHPEVDVTAALKGLASFDRRLAELRAQLAQTTTQRLLLRMAGISRDQWEAEPIDVRSATVAALWEITILPATHRGPGFSPTSVRLERRRSSAAGASELTTAAVPLAGS